MPGDVYVVTANQLNCRAQGGLDAPVIAILPRGTQLERRGTEDNCTKWWLVKAATLDQPGYVSRRYLASQSAGAIDVPLGANETLWFATQDAIAAGVRYHLGAKHSSQGSIDCSGWVGEITRKAFDAVNLATAPGVAFDKSDYSVFDTHSDGIITGIEARTGLVLHGPDVTRDNLREGMLIGCNFGDYSWEQDTPPRVYGIDHIVQTVRDPSGRFYITQSSSSGNGVNLVDLAQWLDARRQTGMLESNRVHAVDPFLLDDPHVGVVSAKALPLSPPTSLAAATVSPTAFASTLPSEKLPAQAAAANVAAFSGRGAYIYSLQDTLKRYGSVDAAAKEMQRCRLRHLWVRIHGRNYIGDAPNADVSRLKSLIGAAKNLGIAVAGWGWCQGDDIHGEVALAASALTTFGLNSYVADIEQGVNNAQWDANGVSQFLNGIRPAVDGLCVTSHGFIDWHDPEIFTPSKDIVDCFNPQVYWYDTFPSQKMISQAQVDPAQYRVADPVSYAKLCVLRWDALYGRPIAVAGQAYSESDFPDTDAEAKLDVFVKEYQPSAKVIGVNYWYWGAMTPPMRDAIANSSRPMP